MNKYGLKRYLAGAAVLLAAVIMIGVSFNRMKTRAAETENVEFKASGLAVDERPVAFRDNKAEVKLIVSGNIMLVYVDDVALASRCYEIGIGEVGVFVEYGDVRCTQTRLLEQ